MNNYINFSHKPHTLYVRSRKTDVLVFRKVFENENSALLYLNYVREYKNNSKELTFNITGPNMYYSC